jgi:hypothetical protein
MRSLALVVSLSTALAAPALAKGPPWVSVEIRAHASSNHPGWLVIRTFHHADAVGYPLSGTAEGLVNGRRVSVPLRFEILNPDSQSGVFLVPTVWAQGSPWVLNIALDAGEHMGAGVVVAVGPSGDPAFVRFPRVVEGYTRPATRSEVDQLLAALAGYQEPPRLSRGDVVGFVRRNPAPLATLGAIALVATWLVSLPVRRLARTRTLAPST